MTALRPLDGTLVVAVEQAVAAPFATRQLADLGARVIKVERIGTGDFARQYDECVVDGVSSAFLWLNRGKESMTLDIRTADGHAVLERLLDVCDVLVQNLSPTATRRLQLDPASVSSRHPDVITCEISGYGDDGPSADQKAYDLLIQAETGLISLTGDDERMAKVGISAADIAAGSFAYSSILAALLHKHRTGEVLPVHISMFDALIEWLGYPLYYTIYGGSAPKRTGTSHATIVPYGVFSTRDGRDIVLAVQNDREWVRFCDVVLGNPKLSTAPGFQSHHARVLNRKTVVDRIQSRLRALDYPTVVKLLTDADIAFAQLNSISDVADLPELAERRRWTDTKVPTGSVRTLLPPWLPRAPTVGLGEVPALGANTDEILTWIGLPSDEIARLRNNKII